MVFSSLPLYLDPPNWQPLTNRQPGGNSTQDSDQVPPPPPPPPLAGGGSGGGVGSIRPVSMTDRARMAKIPQPEAGLKCPRCESTNTKFCYFNNYNLSQPRHFCKTCRRYWTRGGALRNVPVGGGCRRNKRTKPRNRSKSPAGERQLAGSTSTTAVSSQPHLPFLPSLHHLSDYGLNLGMIPPPAPATSGGGATATGGSDIHEFQGVPNSTSCITTDHWRLQQPHQFPLLASEQPALLYSYEPPEGAAATRYNLGASAGQLGFSRLQLENNVGMTPEGAVKMEESKGLNLSKSFQFWAGGGGDINAWAGTDLHGFSSSSTGHFL